jgi:predicted S18 family serine protease
LADFSLTDTISDNADKDAKLEIIKNSTDLNEYYTEAVTALQAKNQHTENYDRLRVAYDNLESQKNTLTTSIKNITDNKKEANKQFYSIYHRFIQEGTWQSEEYIDDEKYYLDA